MKKMIFTIPEKLADRMDKAIKRDGFVNRPDFWRFLAMQYLDRSETRDAQ